MKNTISTITKSEVGTSPVCSTSIIASAKPVRAGSARKRTPVRQTTVAERLQILKAKWEEAEEIEGATAGREWAEQNANSAKLNRLATSDDLWWGLFCHDYSELPVGEQLYYAIRPDQDGNQEAALDFWKSVTGARELPDRGFVLAFAERAQWSWDQAQH